MNVNPGDGTDLFGAIAGIVLSAESSPHSREWDGRESGLVLSDITAPGDTIQFSVGQAAPAQIVVGTADPMITIPDNNTTGVASTIAIAESGTVAQIKVRIDIEHTYIGDLRVELTSPGGRRTVLHAQQGGSADNLVTTYDSTSPGVLTTMVGQPMKGDWVLNVSDRVRRDEGKLKSWRLELRSAQVGVAMLVAAAGGGRR
jgi:subtilisin-like proprotein convertase family protein